MKDNQKKPSKNENELLIRKNIDLIIGQIQDFLERKDPSKFDGMKFDCFGVTVDINIDYTKLK